MTSPRTPIAVRLESVDPARLAAWRRMLADYRLLAESEAAEAEVLVTDRGSSPCVNGPGIVGIGADVSGDVILPADHLPRELVVAVRLLGENVRLRRTGAAPEPDWRQLALTDPLTGLANRRAWDERVARLTPEEIARLSLAILDLDRFKDINDRFGHVAGDAVLRQAAEALAATVRARDFLARLGGDEFGVLLFDCRDGLAAAERIRDAVGAATYAAAPGAPISASAGVAAGADFVAADVALRLAKTAGRNCTRS